MVRLSRSSQGSGMYRDVSLQTIVTKVRLGGTSRGMRKGDLCGIYYAGPCMTGVPPTRRGALSRLIIRITRVTIWIISLTFQVGQVLHISGQSEVYTINPTIAILKHKHHPTFDLQMKATCMCCVAHTPMQNPSVSMVSLRHRTIQQSTTRGKIQLQLYDRNSPNPKMATFWMR